MGGRLFGLRSQFSAEPGNEQATADQFVDHLCLDGKLPEGPCRGAAGLEGQLEQRQ
jgi:hypothetical protein